MNPTPDQASPAPHPPSADLVSPSADLVQVVLGECSVADADTVFTVLRAHFPSDRGADAPRQTEDPGPAVWTGGFLAAQSPGHVPGTLLAGPVTADLHGGPVAVGRLREALESAFVVTAVGTASGDQEVDVQLRLTGPDHGAPIGEG